MAASQAHPQQASVVGTVHNLSATGPGEIKSSSETEVCKFCHVPHSAVEPVPLWSHALSRAERYETPLLRRATAPEEAPQPAGSSRLCLSCHDGTVALGDLGQLRLPIQMAGAQRLGRGHKGYLGTDLSGSHPVSIPIVDPDPVRTNALTDMSLRPSTESRGGALSLDAEGRMQCSTCHDPHSDRHYRPGETPHFWVRPTVDEVCLACHEPS